jgi:CRISPR-associated endonuclease/helicase Cas3
MTLPPQPGFAEFFHALWGHPPYRWQQWLAERVTAGDWPHTIGVPTGTGKTSAIDVALYALSAEAHLPPHARRQPRRILVVVDRRTIVDQAFDRAVSIRKKLADARSGPLHAVATRLRALMGNEAEQEDPLAAALLRGGLPRDDGWARRPDQPLVAVSTVDQVGSRLLFRGYGVRPTMQPIHAGLLGNDALLLLDEVHLSRPFEETLDALAGRWRTWHEGELPDRWRFVRLSATSGPGERAEGDALALRDAVLDDPQLTKRLHASKPTRVVAVDAATHRGKPGEPAKAWIEGIVRETRRLVDQGCRSIAVVVNRVDTARAVHETLSGRSELHATLLTGRMRPCDRADVVRDVEVRAGPDRAEDANADKPFVCVATQCIEAGADLDFDALITELASLDALVQRFGRANRTGKRGAAPIVVLAPKLGGPDPIYGDALAHTLAWLQAQGDSFDASTAGLGERIATADKAAWPPRAVAAVLLPPHIDLLAQTAPTPEPTPDPSLYLHGLAPARPEVRVVWRADLHLGDEEGARARLESVPPTSFEALSLPIGAARRWLRREAPGSFGDAGSDREEEEFQRRTGDPVGYIDSKDGWRLATAAELRPDAIIVLPSSFGGLRAGSFDPASRAPVSDQGDLGVTLRSGRPTLRLDPAVYGGGDTDGAPQAWPAGVPAPPPVPTDSEFTSLAESRRALKTWLATIGEEAPPLWRHLRDRASRVSVAVVGNAWVLVGSPLSPEALRKLGRGQEEPLDAALTGDDNSTAIGRAVPLEVHLRGVESWARSLAHACGLPAPLVADLARAGRWHDLGKADARFQVMLHGGDEIRAAGSAPLAKSGMTALDRAARQRAAEAARLPSGFRHEMASVALLQSSEAGRALLEACHDPALVLHLVASHHGHARPFAPTEDHRRADATLRVNAEVEGVMLDAPADHGMDALDSGVAERFFTVQRRYGWWGLAWLEAILRLADHRESEVEARVTQEET